MEDFKIKIFKEETGKEFPDFEKINPTEVEHLIDTIKKTIIKEGNDDENVYILMSQTTYYKTEHPDDQPLIEVFNELNFPIPEKLYIIWHFDEADLMCSKDIIEYWEYIWYDIGDDALILYNKEDNKWILITHWHAVYAN